MKTHAIIAIVNGLTAQLMINVYAMGFLFSLTCSNSEYFTFSIIGYIIIKSTTAMGIDTLANSIFAKNEDKSGKEKPRTIPIMMQITTHNERYLLNTSSSFS